MPFGMLKLQLFCDYGSLKEPRQSRQKYKNYTTLEVVSQKVSQFGGLKNTPAVSA